jgi:hypothetical protein
MMDQTVALLAAAVCLFGTALGLRFSVYVLIPAGVAILIVSSMALIWNNMAGWGIHGALGLLILLNAGFALGLFLRAGAAFWSTQRIARLFARPAVTLDQPMRRPDGAGREASSEGCGPTATITSRDLAKESFRR